MPSDAMTEEMEERAKELLEESDSSFDLAFRAVQFEVALREMYIQFIQYRDHYDPEFNGQQEKDRLLDACEEGKVLEFAKGEYDG